MLIVSNWQLYTGGMACESQQSSVKFQTHNQHKQESHEWLNQLSDAFCSTYLRFEPSKPLQMPCDTAVNRLPKHRICGYPNLCWLQVSGPGAARLARAAREVPLAPAAQRACWQQTQDASVRDSLLPRHGRRHVLPSPSMLLDCSHQN